MRKTKYLSVTIAVLIALITNSAGIAALPGHTQLAKAKEPERLVARKLGLTGTAEEEFVKQVEIRELTGKALQEAVSVAQADAKSQMALRDLRQRGYKMLDGSATGVTVIVHSDTGHRSATAVLWDYQGPTAKQMATFVHLSDDQGLVRVGVGLVELHGGEARQLQVFEVQGNKLIQESAWAIREDGTVVSEGVDSLDLPSGQCKTTGVSGLSGNGDDCATCIGICDALYAMGCGIGGILFCHLICIPFAGPTCPLICAGVYLLYCVVGGYLGCGMICGPPPGLGYCD